MLLILWVLPCKECLLADGMSSAAGTGATDPSTGSPADVWLESLILHQRNYSRCSSLKTFRRPAAENKHGIELLANALYAPKRRPHLLMVWQRLMEWVRQILLQVHLQEHGFSLFILHSRSIEGVSKEFACRPLKVGGLGLQ